tara:strand:- start:4476 stop:5651 length:1176 start_codon:yes stop_codon:yes gene_type:complete
MRLLALTIYGFTWMNFTFESDGYSTQAIDPITVEVDHFHLSVTQLPISLPAAAAGIGHPVWAHSGRITTVAPVGPIGVDIGSPLGLRAVLSSDPVAIYHPVEFDFEAGDHVFPVISGTAATLSLHRGSSRLWTESVVAGNTSASTIGKVVLSTKRLGAYISVATDGDSRLILPHAAGSMYDAAAVISTVLLAGYLSLLVGFKHIAVDGECRELRTRALLLLVDGPLAALGVILGASMTFDENAAWRYVRHWTLVAVASAGVGLVLIKRLRCHESSNILISDAERRLIEPSLAVALQAPFKGQLGILTQLIAGLACAATCVRGTKLISKGDWVVMLENAFRLLVVGWLSPVLIRTSIMDAMESSKFLWTFPPALAISLMVATHFAATPAKAA